MVDVHKLYEKMNSGETVYAVLCANFTYYVWPVVITNIISVCGEVVNCIVGEDVGEIPPSELFETKEEAEKVANRLQHERGMKLVSQKQYNNMIDREELLKRIFPLGVPPKHEMNYAINARAVYEAIMKE
jgi:hypothetical protein